MINLRTDVSASQIDFLEETIDQLFGEEGELVTQFGLDYRSSQHALAKDIARSFFEKWKSPCGGGNGRGQELGVPHSGDHHGV